MVALRLRFQPRLLLLVLATGMGLVLLGSFAVQGVQRVWGHDYLFGLSPLLNVDGEGNLPAWLSSMTLFVCALVALSLGTGAADPGEGRRGWLLMAFVLLLLSMDEGAQLHERAYGLSGRLGGNSRMVMVGAVVAALVLFGRFVQRIPSGTRTWIVVAFLLFVTGAFGFEVITLRFIYDGLAKNTFFYSVLSHTEEALEMAGLIVLLAALLQRLEALAPETTVTPSKPSVTS